MEVDTGAEADSTDLDADTEVEDAMKNGLKRSCSAPLINQLVAAEPLPASIRLRGSSYLPAAAASRWRRWSTSISPVSPGGGAGSGQGAGWARLNKLRVEETKDQAKREIANEREVQRGISVENKLSQSWEDLSLVSLLLLHRLFLLYMSPEQHLPKISK